VFVDHGEPGPADALRQRIEKELGWVATVPRLGQAFDLGSRRGTEAVDRRSED
jgi:metallo-beta-lactamase family protein